MTDITRTTIVHQHNGASNHLLQSRAPVSNNQHPSRASFSYRGLENLSSGSKTPPSVLKENRATVLLIDPPSSPSETLKAQIERATGWLLAHASSLADGLKILLASREKVRILVFTINHDHARVLRFIRTVNRLSATGRVSRPFFLALLPSSQPPDFSARLDGLGVQTLLRKYPEQIVETIRKLQWLARSTNGLPTIIVERRSGYITGIKVHYQGTTERMGVGPRLKSLAAYLVVHSKTEHSTEILADALRISRQSVKEYLLRLRRAFDRISGKLGTPLRGKDVFWTKRVPGGHVHRLKANVEIEDSDEFYFPEEVDEDVTSPARCTVCKWRKPGTETTRSHLGWLCLDCCRELNDIGEV